MVKKLIMILVAHSCDKNDSSCAWTKRMLDAYPPKVGHGSKLHEHGEMKVFMADVFDRSRIAEILGVELKARHPTGRPRGRPRTRPVTIKGDGTNYTVDPSTLAAFRGVDRESIVWPESMDPKVIRQIEKMITA